MFLFELSKFKRSNSSIMGSLFRSIFLLGKYQPPLFSHGSDYLPEGVIIHCKSWLRESLLSASYSNCSTGTKRVSGISRFIFYCLNFSRFLSSVKYISFSVISFTIRLKCYCLPLCFRYFFFQVLTSTEPLSLYQCFLVLPPNLKQLMKNTEAFWNKM